MADLNWLRRLSVPQFVGYLVLVGALSGLFAWCLVLAGHLVFDVSRPTGLALLLAIPRGSLYGLIVGFGLRLWWRVRGDGAGSITEFSHGDSLLPGLANVETDGVQPVGTFPANVWGLHDMLGNVVEWVQDGYGGYPASDQTDPIGPDHIGRMLRGGGWDREDWHARCSYRYAHLPSRGDQGAGFRIAITPQQNRSPSLRGP